MAPETSLRFGVIGVYFFRFKNAKKGTQLSSFRAPQSYTIKSQVKFRLSNDIFFNDNKHIISGFTEWLRFPLFFYGVGAETKNNDKEIYTSRVFNISYTYLLKVKTGTYLGFRFDRRDSKVQQTEEGGLLEQPGVVAGNSGGVSQGIGIVGRYDTRDNLQSTKTGLLSQFTLTSYNNVLNSDFVFTKMSVDSRIFIDVNDKHVFGGQIFFEQNWGSPSFETLALMGGPFLMRGNFEGRFRDKAMWATQVEYRVPFGRNTYIDDSDDNRFWNRFGAVGFFGVGSVLENLVEETLNDIKVTGGVGLRFLLFPEERINIRVDAGFGTETPAFYIFVRESF